MAELEAPPADDSLPPTTEMPVPSSPHVVLLVHCDPRVIHERDADAVCLSAFIEDVFDTIYIPMDITHADMVGLLAHRVQAMSKFDNDDFNMHSIVLFHDTGGGKGAELRNEESWREGREFLEKDSKAWLGFLFARVPEPKAKRCAVM